MSPGGFYDAGPLRQIAANLFYGWGYGFYRSERRLGADEQLVRTKAAWLMSLALGTVQAAEAGFRRAFLPAPSRTSPFHDPDSARAAELLEQLGADILALKGRMLAEPAAQPWVRQHALLQALIDCDEHLVGQAELLRTMLTGRDGLWMLHNMVDLEGGLAAIGATLRRREQSLTCSA